ncbi:MAG TPA: type III-A CRISPR-associated RAMP protein Csm3 [Planctomycetota bacterium]|nr:type III-A CRISPR-associated RAMP protein Csm3 [Planctomycetota bacterium]
MTDSNNNASSPKKDEGTPPADQEGVAAAAPLDTPTDGPAAEGGSEDQETTAGREEESEETASEQEERNDRGPVSVPKLDRKVYLKGTITCLSGLHIGGSGGSLDIGGADHPVQRNRLTREPYIPGSSLKGKIRFLVERAEGVLPADRRHRSRNDPPDHSPITRLFGTKAGGGGATVTRLIVRDAALANAEMLRKSPDLDLPYTEVKTELSIDRITAGSAPRQLERVPAGAKFTYEMVVSLYEGDDAPELLKVLFNGLVLLADDYLGGYGSRGSGQVAVTVDGVTSRDKAGLLSSTPAAPYAVEIPAALQGAVAAKA